MKKIKWLVVALVLLLVTVAIAILAGCGSEAEKFAYDNSEKLAGIPNDIEVIKGSLVYYKDTRVVYIMISIDSGWDDETFSYFAPYISENGKYCRYVNGDIVEIE